MLPLHAPACRTPEGEVATVEPLGELLRARREELRIGQSELADRLGVSQQTVSRWEGGQALPRPRRLAELADVLRLDAERLHRAAGFLLDDDDDGDAVGDTGLGPLLRAVTVLDEAQLLQLVDAAWQELARRRGVDLGRS